jgi:hypothetical protein
VRLAVDKRDGISKIKNPAFGLKPHGGSGCIGQMLETIKYIDKNLCVNKKMHNARIFYQV